MMITVIQGQMVEDQSKYARKHMVAYLCSLARAHISQGEFDLRLILI